MRDTTTRSRDLLVKQGYTVGSTERWNSFAGPINPKTGKPTGIRQDLFGFMDLEAIKSGEVPIAVQSTAEDVRSRINKIRDETRAMIWLRTGSRILVIGWRARAAYKVDGTRAKRDKHVPVVLEVMERAEIEIDPDDIGITARDYISEEHPYPRAEDSVLGDLLEW